MEFRTLLSQLENAFNTASFSAKSVTNVLIPGINSTNDSIPIGQKTYRRSVKTFSNELGRLYSMGFLCRSRVKRKVETRSGKKCNRGFEYLYKVSAQGHSYSKYMTTNPTLVSKRDHESVVDTLLIHYLENKVLPDNQAQLARKI